MVFPFQIVLKFYSLFGTSSLDTNDRYDQTEIFKVQLTLNNVGVGVRDTDPYVVENLHVTFDSPKT